MNLKTLPERLLQSGPQRERDRNHTQRERVHRTQYQLYQRHQGSALTHYYYYYTTVAPGVGPSAEERGHRERESLK